MATDPAAKLTPEQVKNWRDTLCGMIGPYALVMSEERINKMRDRFQAIADSEASKHPCSSEGDKQP
jgi:hypothetical protein